MLITVNQSKHVLYSRDLSDTTKWRTQVKMNMKSPFKFIEEVHNCRATVYKDIKNKQTKNGEARGQSGFRPNFSTS